MFHASFSKPPPLDFISNLVLVLVIELHGSFLDGRKLLQIARVRKFEGEFA